jgi:uncharacterized heparinase superfamily protein
VDLRDPPRLRAASAQYVTPIRPEPSLIAPDTFRFLNVERPCRQAGDWHRPDTAKLWTYNLHYFDDLNAREADGRRDVHLVLLERWVAENPPPRRDGWEPYPVSRRIVNWVKWSCLGNRLPPACHASLAVQTRWLMRRLEYHILGNHLFANGKALVYSGLYFEGEEADRWYERGMRILAKELPAQVLADGGHFELSPMYHAVVLEDLLDLVNAVRAFGREPRVAWLDAIARMRRWLRLMSHADGGITFFNDAAFGSGPDVSALEAYCGRLGLPAARDDVPPLVTLDSSGYVRAQAGQGLLFCDCALVGPSYLPGHAHADTLSCELSISGRRVIVNSGTSEYGSTAERLRQRGTAAHSTVVVDGQNSSDVWGGFRVAKRARADLNEARATADGIRICATHDGYRDRPGRNLHRRRWSLAERSLKIDDEVTGPFQSAEAMWYLHPDIEPGERSAHGLHLSGPENLRVQVAFEGASDVCVKRSTWHPMFGVTVPNHCIVARFGGASLSTRWTW